MKGHQSKSIPYNNKFTENIIMHVPGKSKRFFCLFRKIICFLFVLARKGNGFHQQSQNAIFYNSFFRRSVYPGLLVKCGFTHSAAFEGFLDVYFFLFPQVYGLLKMLRRFQRRPSKPDAPGNAASIPSACRCRRSSSAS